MFRPMRRFKQQIADSECKEILKNEKRRVLSLLGDDGYPYGFHFLTFTTKKPIRFIFTAQKKATKLMP